MQKLVDASEPGIRVSTGSRATLSYTSVHVVSVPAENLVFHVKHQYQPARVGDRLRLSQESGRLFAAGRVLAALANPDCGQGTVRIRSSGPFRL